MNDPHAPAPAAGAPACPFPWIGPTGLQADIVRALRRVVDPEVALTIVDLGLIYGAEVSGEAAAPLLKLRLTMTSAACPVIDLILDEIENELDPVLPEAWRVQLQLVWDPPWSPAMMSEQARQRMA